MLPAASSVIAPEKLTICAIGSSTSNHVRNRVKCFAERGHAIRFVTDRDDLSQEPGITTVIPKSPVNIPILRGILKAFNYFAAVQSTPSDIVHAHYADTFGTWIAAASNRHPLVVSTMGGDVLFDERGGISPIRRWMVMQAFAAADLITSKSDHITAALGKHGGYNSKAMKVVWGVNTNEFRKVDASSLRERLGLSPEELIIFSPKRFTPLFNIHLVVEAMPKILAVYPKAKLLLTEYQADPTYRKEVVALIERLGLQKPVVFVGYIEHEEMPQFYSLADIAIGIPSSDGIPQSLFEAMACGVPHILSRLPHYEEVVKHKESAYFVDICVDSIAEAVNELLGNVELHTNIITNAMDVVQEQASFDAEVRRVEREYYRLLNLPKKGVSVLDRFKMVMAIFLYAAQKF